MGSKHGVYWTGPEREKAGLEWMASQENKKWKDRHIQGLEGRKGTDKGAKLQKPRRKKNISQRSRCAQTLQVEFWNTLNAEGRCWKEVGGDTCLDAPARKKVGWKRTHMGCLAKGSCHQIKLELCLWKAMTVERWKMAEETRREVDLTWKVIMFGF